MLRALNKKPAVVHFRKMLPPFLVPAFDVAVNFLTYRVYERWYRRGIVGSMRYARYVLRRHERNDRRILGINDFLTTDVSFGILIEHQIRTLCEAHIHEVEKIDYAFVYDRERPSRHSKYAGWITKENVPLHFIEIFPVLRTNPKLGSVHIFDSRDEFESFLAERRGKYILTPSLFDYVNSNSPYRRGYLFFKEFYERYGSLPKLKIPALTDAWARAFIKKHAPGYAVAVSLRSNPFFASHRNAKPKVWREFFRYCSKQYPECTFIILGRGAEINEALRGPNVIFTKDYGTNSEQDLALVQRALFYLCVSSGPLSWAFLRDDIAYFASSFVMPDVANNYSWLKEGDSFPWQRQAFQKVSWEQETLETLKKEFAHLISVSDMRKWKENIEEADLGVLTWPHTLAPRGSA